MVQRIWEPVRFDAGWTKANTEKFDNLVPSWERKREELQNNQEQYEDFINFLKRKQAIDTGIIERMYDLERGVTETFIKEGFVESYLQHGDTNINQRLLMDYLRDNFQAIDFIFSFVKSSRELSVSFIKELHSLITLHQDAIDAVDSFGNIGKIRLLKGEFKKMDNNPQRSDGVVFLYCPPLQVDSEMDNLIKIFNNDLQDEHILIKTAFLHHAFVKIHPFQDGNGRIARLLASFVLIKDKLFPFSLDREEKTAYIDALEDADKGNYQNFVNIILKNQVKSIEQALNLETVKRDGNYASVLHELNNRIDKKNKTAAIQKDAITNMKSVFYKIKELAEHYKDDLKDKLGDALAVELEACEPSGDKEHYYAYQIAQYAKEHKYYFNSSLPRCWARIRMKFDDTRKYQLVLSLHHYGYDNGTFAIGSFMEKAQHEKTQSDKTHSSEILIPSVLPPLVFSSEKDISNMEKSIQGHIEGIFTSTLAYIAEELS
jgi:fido (protein-threonine AMPylation protein)